MIYKNSEKRGLCQKSLFLIFVIFIFSIPLALLQAHDTIQNLQTQRRNLVKQITRIQKNLKKNELKLNQKSKQIVALTKQIEIKILFLQIIDKEVSEVEKEIEKKKKSISILLCDLELLKKEYAKIIYIGYKATHGLGQITYIFSSSSFDQLAERIKSIKHYAKFRKKHFEEIKKIYSTLCKQRESSEKFFLQKKSLLLLKKQEIKDLTSLKKEYSILAQDLTKNQEILKKELQTHNSTVVKLDSLIKSIIEKSIKDTELSIKRQKEKLRVSLIKKEIIYNSKSEPIKGLAKYSENINHISNRETRQTLKKENKNSNNNDFAMHKGNLPWPVDHGIIIGKVGIWPHPILKGIQIENLGINIQTDSENKVKAIFDGEIKSITYMPGMQNVVIIKHGDYYTVYTRLKNICVKTGEFIKQGQVLGTVYTDESGYTETQLQIWEGTTKINPQHWLKSYSGE